MQQGVALKREIQTYISPHAWFQDQLKECITRATEITTDQGEHKVDQGKVKTMEDIDATAMDQFKKDFKLKRLSSIDFIIPNEFNDMEWKIDSLSLVLPKVFEEWV